MQEMDEVAEWSAAERESAGQREGRSAHQHDYHRADAWNLRLRERVNAAVAEAPHRTAQRRRLPRPSFAERARQEAWAEIAGEIDARLAREWPEIEVDEAYERERDERMRGLELDLEREVADARRRRETSTSSTTRSAPGRADAPPLGRRWARLTGDSALLSRGGPAPRTGYAAGRSSATSDSTRDRMSSRTRRTVSRSLPAGSSSSQSS